MESLRKKADISRVYKLGKVSRSEQFAIKALKSNTKTVAVAIVISKKVSKSAVVRNRARRRVREIIRRNQSFYNSGYFVIVNIYSDLTQIKPTELETKVIDCLRKLGVYSQDNKQ